MSMRRLSSALRATAEAYTNGGVQAAIDECTKRGYVTYKHCAACEAIQPMIIESYRLDGKIHTACECGVCGSSVTSPSEVKRCHNCTVKI
jgi:hypothetical protein